MLKIGSHVGLSGEDMLLGAVKEALSYGATAMMIYTGAPQNTLRKPMTSFKIQEAYDYMDTNGFSKDNMIVHAPYIINLANPDPEKRAFAISFLSEEVRRTEALGVGQMVLHPGSAVGKDREEATKWIAEGLLQVFENTKSSKVKIALETMAGKGNEIGKTFEEIKAIMDLCAGHQRLSVCFDTCHVHDAGYDLKNHYDAIKKSFDDIVGLKHISVLHINDTKNEVGAHKDRHENIGFGYLGFDILNQIVHDPDFKDIVKILETPYVDDKAPYLEEINAFKTQTFNPNLKEIIHAKVR
jgi:deoxyribonuclease IV